MQESFSSARIQWGGGGGGPDPLENPVQSARAHSHNRCTTYSTVSEASVPVRPNL